MDRMKTKRVRNSFESQLATRMRSVVEARFQLERARERLHKINQNLRNTDSNTLEHQREKALGEYIEAMGEARVARTRLLKELREHTAL